MQDTKKIKVSMWPDLLPHIDAAAKRRGISRSAFLRYAALQIIYKDNPDLVWQKASRPLEGLAQN